MLYLRTTADSERLRAAFQAAPRVVVAGAGWIGLETTAAARSYGCPVIVLEPQPGALQDQLGPELGAVFADLHRSHGVDFRFGERAAEFRPGMVITSAGAEVPADLFVVGIGAAPNDRLAAAAGLEVDNGVLTDEYLRTSDENIFAAGDVANSFNPLLGRQVRVEHWANALNGGPAAARSMLGQPVVYDPVPYFYSDQYDLGMECAGLPSPGRYDQVVYRGDRDSSGVHRVLAPPRYRHRRHERQRLGRQRRHPVPHPLRPPNRPHPPNQPRHPPDRSLSFPRRSAPSRPGTEPSPRRHPRARPNPSPAEALLTWLPYNEPVTAASTSEASVRPGSTTCAPAAARSAAEKLPVATPTARAPVASAAATSSGVSPISTVDWPPKSAPYAARAARLATGTSSARTSCTSPYAPTSRSRCSPSPAAASFAVASGRMLPVSTDWRAPAAASAAIAAAAPGSART